MIQRDIQFTQQPRVWNRQRIFVLSCIGVIVGFSNFWTFPALMTQYGGVPFLASYGLALLCFALPLMILQMGIGKNIRKSPVLALQQLGGGSRFSLWKWSGLLLVGAATLTVVIYSVVAGMGMAYAFKSAFGEFAGADPAKITRVFAALQQDSTQMLSWLTLFVVVVYVISIRGMYRGLATAIQYFIPLMAVLLISLLLYSARLPTIDAAIDVLFASDIKGLSWQGVLAAFKQAFFSLALGTGVYILLGAYMPSHGHITRVALTVSLVDMGIGVLAGVIILPWLLMFDLPPDQGFSLLFQSIPLALGGLPLGQFFGVVLFVLLTLAAWSSAIFLIEPLVAWIEERWGRSRWLTTTVVHLGIWAVGAGLVLSLTEQQNWSLLGIPLFSLVQFLVSTFFIPLAGSLLLVLCAFILPTDRLGRALNIAPEKRLFKLGYPLLRYMCVPVLLVIQVALMFDLLAYSCQFENQRQGAFCKMQEEPAMAAGRASDQVDAAGARELDEKGVDEKVEPDEDAESIDHVEEGPMPSVQAELTDSQEAEVAPN